MGKEMRYQEFVEFTRRHLPDYLDLSLCTTCHQKVITAQLPIYAIFRGEDGKIHITRPMVVRTMLYDPKARRIVYFSEQNRIISRFMNFWEGPMCDGVPIPANFRYHILAVSEKWHSNEGIDAIYEVLAAHQETYEHITTFYKETITRPTVTTLATVLDSWFAPYAEEVDLLLRMRVHRW